MIPYVQELRLTNGLVIKWDGARKVKLWTLPSLAGQVCGICGPLTDYTGDLVVGPHDLHHMDDATGCPNKASDQAFGSIVRDQYQRKSLLIVNHTI